MLSGRKIEGSNPGQTTNQGLKAGKIMLFSFLSFAQMTISLGSDVRSWPDLFLPLINQFEEDVKEPT